MKKLLLFVLISCSLSAKSASVDTLKVSSPDGKLMVKVWMSDHLNYSVQLRNSTITGNSVIDLLPIGQKALSDQNRMVSHKLNQVKSQIVVPVPERRKVITDNYNELVIKFKQPYEVKFRIYDEGMAYRISTLFKDSLYIKNEVARFSFLNNPTVYFPQIHKKSNADIFHTSFEELYPLLTMSSIPDSAIAFSPVLVVPSRNPKIAITESDLRDYPGMFLNVRGVGGIEFDVLPFTSVGSQALPK